MVLDIDDSSVPKGRGRGRGAGQVIKINLMQL
jgi:hypothetical protein